MYIKLVMIWESLRAFTFQPAGLKVFLLYFFCEQDSNENKQPKYLLVVYQKYSISQLIAPAPTEPVGGQLIINTCNYLIV